MTHAEEVMNQFSKPSLFIVGYMHSGTSLLQQLIANHPDVYSPPGEVKLIEYLSALPGIEDESSSDLAEFYLNCIYNGVKFSKFVGVEKKFTNSEFECLRMLEFSKDHLMNFFHCLNALRELHGKRFWLEKSPNNIFYSDLITKYVSNPKFIGIVRDSRDVVASKKTRQATIHSGRYREDQIPLKKLEKHSAPLLDAYSWRSTTREILRKSKSHPGSFALVQYEELVSQPEQKVRDIFSFVDLPFDERVLEFSFSNAADPNQKQNNGISKAAVGRYKKVLSAAEICAVQWITSKELRRLELDRCAFPVTVRFKAVFLFLRLPYDIAVRLFKRFKMLGRGNFKSFLKTVLRKLKSV